MWRRPTRIPSSRGGYSHWREKYAPGLYKRHLILPSNYYPKFKCLMVKNYPSLKRWFRYCWEYRDIKSRDVFQEIEDHEPSRNNRDATTYYIQNHFSLSMDIDYQSPLKVLLIRQPKQASLVFVFHPCRGRRDRRFIFHPEIYPVL